MVMHGKRVKRGLDIAIGVFTEYPDTDTKVGQRRSQHGNRLTCEHEIKQL